MKVLAAQINPIIGDIEGNQHQVLLAIERAKALSAEVILFPELTLVGYPPEDLLFDSELIRSAMQALQKIAPFTQGLFVAVGLPRFNETRVEKHLFNSAAILIDGELAGFHDKQLLPTYDVFDERRYFEPGKKISIFEFQKQKIAVTICEDLWQHSRALDETRYSLDPVALLQKKKVDLTLNLSASPYYIKRAAMRRDAFSVAAKALHSPLILCNQVGANDQLVFDGNSCFFDEHGELISQAKGFSEDDLIVDLDAPKKPMVVKESEVEDLYQALVLGIRDYFFKQGFQKAIIGLSGGIDSAITACLAKEALGAKSILSLYLPTRFSSDVSFKEAKGLAERLGIVFRSIDIDPLFETTMQTLAPFFKQKPWDVTEENIQARIRSEILMAFSNKFGALMLNTSNKSEMAMGYTTIYGDMCGGLSPLSDVTKTRIYQLAKWINHSGEVISKTTIERMPTPELKANETYLDTLPPYEILDPIIEDYIEKRLSIADMSQIHKKSESFIRDLVLRMHRAEFKRRQAPIGIRVTQKSFSKGRNVPIVQKWRSSNPESFSLYTQTT